MLVLTSNGISSEDLTNEIQKHISIDRKSAVIITTASAFHPEKDNNIQRHTKRFESLGFTVELFDLAEQSPALLGKYDLIFIMGGNPFYLLHIIRKTNCKEIFTKFIDTKIVIGASAGSIVFGYTISFIYDLEPELNDDVKLTDFTGLCLTNIHIFPHSSVLLEHFDKCQEKLTNFEISTRFKLNLIEDGQGIFINKTDVKFV